MYCYKVAQHFPGIRHAIGATLGQEHLRPLVSELQKRLPLGDPAGEVIVVDFSEVVAMTGSYIKAFLLWLYKAGQLSVQDGQSREHLSQIIPLNIFPLVAGLTSEIEEELLLVLATQRLPVLEALSWDNIAVKSARLRGSLDNALLSTLDILLKEKSATAASLHERYPGVGINPTGWNNRLAELHRLRLIRRSRQGRQWIYQPVAEEISRG